MISHDFKTTDNHETIKKWIKDRYAEPALVEGVVNPGKAGRMLRINFQNHARESLKDISWELFFEIFDENDLEFLYQEQNLDGSQSKSFEFIKKDRENN